MRLLSMPDYGDAYTKRSTKTYDKVKGHAENAVFHGENCDLGPGYG